MLSEDTLNGDMSTLLNDLLYFVNFKRKINPIADVVSICESFYSADVILEAKKLFFDRVVGKPDKADGVFRFIGRRGDNPQRSNLEDFLK